MKKEDIQYILKHAPTSLYLKDKLGEEFTKNISKARTWPPNNKTDAADWHELMETNEYTVIKRTYTEITEYEEVDLSD